MIIGVIVAHPDDEVLGCGGTIARLVDEHEVHIAILGEGLSSRYDRREDAASRELQRLQDEARAAATLLGEIGRASCRERVYVLV